MAEISLQEYYEQVEDMIDQGRYAQAVANGKHILGKYPKYVAGYRLLGRAMLESRRDGDALDMFLRVLSADPEDMLSWVAMSEIYDRRDELDASVWCLERAFELSVDNQLVGEELRQLYGRRDGVEPERVELTRGALARLYLKGDLLSRSVSEFRTLLDEQPDRADLGVAFAEALWRNEQRLESSEVCQRILDKLPYCLKANLLLGEIWVNSGREEGQTYLRRAEALDPQNAMAQELFGDASPLLARDARITSLEYMPPTEEERPAWMTEAEAAAVEGPPLTDGEAALVDIAAALEAQIEIPSWLEEIDVGEAAETPEVPAFMASAEEPEEEVEEPAFAPEEETPEWLTSPDKELGFAVEAMEQEPGAELVVGEEDIVSEQVPDWLAGLDSEPTDGGEEAPDEGAVPDFLSEIGAGVFAEELEPSEEEVPDWLAGLREQAAEDVQEPSPVQPAPAEIPDWMQELAPEAEEPALGEAPAPLAEEPILGGAEEPAPSAAEEAAPPWLEGEGMPSGEEALAWLEQLASGKEDELQAQVEAEIEARTAEIMGRPKTEEPAGEEPVAVEPVAEEVVVEEPAPVAEVLPEPAPAEIPDWMQELAPTEAEMPAPLAEEPVLGAVEEPAPSAAEEAAPLWLEGEGMPSGEEALAWLEQLASGKEEELQAQVEAEIEARTAEIMGRPKAVEPAGEAPVGEEPVAVEPVTGEVVAEEPVVEEPAPVAEVLPEPAPAEMPDWIKGLAPPEAAVPAPSVEEPVPSVAEEAFGWTAFGEPAVSADVVPEAEEPVLGVVEEAAPVMEEAMPEMPPPPALAVEEPVPSVVEEPVPSADRVPEAEEAFGWTAFGEPEVSADVVPEAEGPALGVVEEAAPVMEEAIPEVPPAPVIEEPVVSVSEAEEAFGWTAFGEPEVFAPGEAEGVAAEMEEAIPEAAPAPPVEGPPPGVVEEVMAEAVAAPLVEEMVPDVVEEIVVPAAEEPEAPSVAEIPVEEAPVPAAPPPVAPAPEVRAAPPVAAAPPPRPRPKPAVADSADPFAPEMAYLKENPRDYDARLNLARALWQAGRRRESLESYSRLVRAGKALDVVTTELEEYLEQWPDVSTQRVLGDAYMKSNQLEKALDIYRQALENL